ncbi:MAG: type I neck protein [Chaetfec virus UA24_144]|nr:MAG: type I neck protein [Chaetfec virus UA24_144]
MIVVEAKGDFKKVDTYFKKLKKFEIKRVLDKYGKQGVKALASATPTRTGKTASSWEYKVKASRGLYSITWSNTNVNRGVNIAIILQYGHGTRNGGYVQGRDYINPAMRGIFDQMADEAWREITKL